MKALMYHYVRPQPRDLPYFRYLHVDDFRNQLDFLAAADRFVGRDEFVAACRTGVAPSDGVILTFDDGFSDHYRHVLPCLAERGLWGVFYVPSGPYATGKLLDVHRIHMLLGAFGGQQVLDRLDARLEPSMLSHEHVAEFTTATYSRQTNDEATNRCKRLLNYYVSYQWRELLLDDLMRTFFGDERRLVDAFYMSPAELKEMNAAGMLLGSHSVSHPVFSKLNDADQEAEIRDSFAFLDRVVGPLPTRTFCYPYGGFHSFTPVTEQLLTKHGCQFSFNVEPRDIEDRDLKCRPQALPRFDCNQFPHGQARLRA